MNQETFAQNSSITRRLHIVMIMIAIFIIVSTFALYLSSLSSLQKLKQLNNDNNLLNLNSQSIDNLTVLENKIDDAVASKRFEESTYTYDVQFKSLRSLIDQSAVFANNSKSILALLDDLKISIDQSEKNTKSLFSDLSKFNLKDQKTKDNISSEHLVIKQFLLDSKETLRKIQIIVKSDNDLNFNTIYSERFTPLIVTLILSILFLGFVIMFGLSLSRKIARSISHLLEATDHVAHGNLNYEVKVLERDEIGKLTDAFNHMVYSIKMTQAQLSKAMDRTARLQYITAAFSEALTPDQVYDVVLKQAFEALNAITGTVVVFNKEEDLLELKRIEGFKTEVMDKWAKFPKDLPTPYADVIRTGKPLYLTKDEIDARYLASSTIERPSEVKKLVYLPLVIGNSAIGAVCFSFGHLADFDDSEKTFMIALARQCAQAMHRSFLYEDAKKAIEARDEFLSIASHELRTPLTPLKLQIQGISRQIQNADKIDNDRLKKMLNTSDKQITRLSSLIDDLLDVSRITLGKLVLRKTEFSLKEMAEEVLHQYATQLHAQIDLKIEMDSVGIWDKLRIEQVFINLLTNATKYAPDRPIHIIIRREEKFAIFLVRDEGPGIADIDKDRIFKRFERVASSNNVGGLGLGLYISRQIVEAHKGTIILESEPDKGATFIVKLPLEKV